MRKIAFYTLLYGLTSILIACAGKQMAPQQQSAVVSSDALELSDAEIAQSEERRDESLDTSLEVEAPRKKPHEELVYPPLNQPRPPVPQKVELDNGIIVYLLEDHEFPIIEISAWIHTGSIYEPADKIGLAEITGAVMRTGGTTGKTGDELDEILESLAASVETSIGDDSGSASMSVLKEDLDTGLSILADVLMNPAFREDKIELEVVQHRSAIARRNDDPTSITAREFRKLIYGADSPYARTTEYDTINNITRDDLVAFYQKYFHPNNLLIGVLGDFESAAMLATIREVFKEWEPVEIDLPEKPAIPETYARKVALVNKNDVNQTNIRMGHIGWLRNNEDYPALVVMSQILGIGFSSRLMNTIRVEKGLAYSVGNNYGAGYDLPGIFFISCGTKSETTVMTIEAILEEVEKLQSEGITDEELKQAIDGFMNSSVFDYDTKGEILSRALRYEYYEYPQDFVEQLMAGIREVTKADVKRVASEYLHPDRFALIAVGKSNDFDKPLNSLGDVTEVDIAIPAPSPEPVPEAGEETVTRGKEILGYVIEAHGGLDKLKQVKNIVTTGRMVVNTPGGMMELDGEVTLVLPTKARFDIKMPAVGMQMSRIYDGQSAWMVMPQGVQPLPAAFVEEAKKEIFRDSIHLLTYISDKEASVQYLGVEDVKGKMTDVVLVGNTPAGSLKLFIDQETKHIVKKEYQALTEQGPAEREEFLDAYREVSGVMVAFHTVLVDNGEQSAEITFSEVMLNAEVDESLFEK